MMDEKMKNSLIIAISEAIDRVTAETSTTSPQASAPCEMWTIAEAAEQVKGLSVHTIRQFIAQGKIPSIRTGAGRNGKILVPKAALIKYLSGDQN